MPPHRRSRSSRSGESVLVHYEANSGRQILQPQRQESTQTGRHSQELEPPRNPGRFTPPSFRHHCGPDLSSHLSSYHESPGTRCKGNFSRASVPDARRWGNPHKDKTTMVKMINTALVVSPVPSPRVSNLRESESMDCSTSGVCNKGQSDELIPAPNRLPRWCAFFRVQLDRQPVVTRNPHQIRN